MASRAANKPKFSFARPTFLAPHEYKLVLLFFFQSIEGKPNTRVAVHKILITLELFLVVVVAVAVAASAAGI
jgi:hypothetical protein